MSGRRRARVLAQLADGGGGVTTARLCEVSAATTGVSGAGIAVVTDELGEVTIAASDEVSTKIEELHYLLVEGPGIDAYRLGAAVSAADLADPGLGWAAFTPAALAIGVRAIFAFPLRVGSVRLGVLTLYRDRPGVLADDQHADALMMAEVVGQALLLMQAGTPADALGAELETSVDFHHVVHQAAGMVSVQLDVNVAEALTRLRGYAFARDLALATVAADVVARRLRLDGPPLDGPHLDPSPA